MAAKRRLKCWRVWLAHTNAQGGVVGETRTRNFPVLSGTPLPVGPRRHEDNRYRRLDSNQHWMRSERIATTKLGYVGKTSVSRAGVEPATSARSTHRLCQNWATATNAGGAVRAHTERGLSALPLLWATPAQDMLRATPVLSGTSVASEVERVVRRSSRRSTSSVAPTKRQARRDQAEGALLM